MRLWKAFQLLISIIFIVFGILQIILFFKMWGMTNNVSRITRLLESKELPNNTLNNAEIKRMIFSAIHIVTLLWGVLLFVSRMVEKW